LQRCCFLRALPQSIASSPAPKNGLPLQTLTLLDLVHSTDYAQNMELYARILSIAASSERQSKREQVEWIKTYLLTQRCFSSILDAVEDMVDQGSLLSRRSAAACAAGLILESELKYTIPALGRDFLL
jgi:hypothetical protein